VRGQVPRLDRVPFRRFPSLAIGTDPPAASTRRTGNLYVHRRRGRIRGNHGPRLSGLDTSAEAVSRGPGPSRGSPYRSCAGPPDSFARDRGISPTGGKHGSHREHISYSVVVGRSGSPALLPRSLLPRIGGLAGTSSQARCRGRRGAVADGRLRVPAGSWRRGPGPRRRAPGAPRLRGRGVLARRTGAVGAEAASKRGDGWTRPLRGARRDS
jgi:hypothetical protein